MAELLDKRRTRLDESEEEGGEKAAPDLATAVGRAIAAGTRELDRLGRVVDAIARETREVRARAEFDGNLDAQRLAEQVGLSVEALSDRLAGARRTIGTYNLVFFGRTGSGKSTLLSALGNLNGDRISRGPVDWTVDVEPVRWGDVLLWDTPGTQGWGRTETRESLESKARRAVETADIVVLAFDTSNQLAGEFDLVARWVQEYGKPAVAVLNNRNELWRDPAAAPAQATRRALSLQVEQHVGHIESELARVGIPETPIVAVNAKRGLAARGAAAYEGPDAPTIQAMRDRGLDYLDRWSNLPALDRLLTNAVRIGGARLRLAGLRDGFRTEFSKAASAVERLAEALTTTTEQVTERTLDGMLNVLGYPRQSLRSQHLSDSHALDTLTRLERLRRRPFGAPVVGSLATFTTDMLRAHLGAERSRSLHRAEDLILRSFEQRKAANSEEFDRTVFDKGSIDDARRRAFTSIGEFLDARLRLAFDDGATDLSTLEDRFVRVSGDAGEGARSAAGVFGWAHLVTSGVGATLGVIATTNFWNPGGWAAFAILGGIGIVSWFMKRLNRRKLQEAECQRVQARAQAIAEARSAVNRQFDQWEREIADRVSEFAWAGSASSLRALVDRAIGDRERAASLTGLSLLIQQAASEIDQAPSAAAVLSEAVEAMSDPRDPSTNARRTLLGEDWVDHEAASSSPPALSEAQRQSAERRSEETRARVASALQDFGESVDVTRASAWLARLVDRYDGHGEPLLPPASKAPRVVLVGDYSAGKTTLVRRLLAEGYDAAPEARVGGDPVTTEAQAFPFGSLAVVDAPGFQSHEAEHGERALAAAIDAAVVMVVLTPSLLVGDHGHLDEILGGSERIAAKARRALYVIGRVDENGSNPLYAPELFASRCRRKEQELAAALTAAKVPFDRRAIVSVAADPFGLVGSQPSVTSRSYRDEYRVWDGIGCLVEPLLALPRSTRAALAIAGRVDGALARIASETARLSAVVEACSEAAGATEIICGRVQAALDELLALRDGLTADITQGVDDCANEIIGDALGASGVELSVKLARVRTWWNDPTVAQTVAVLETRIADAFDEWRLRHEAELKRELSVLEFRLGDAAADAFATAAPEKSMAGLGKLAGNAANGAKHVGRLLQGVDRSRVLKIGHALGHKFRPWGAVKTATRVGKVGARLAKAAPILNVISLGFDIWDFGRATKQTAEWETFRVELAKFVSDTRAKVLEALLDGTADEVGPRVALNNLADDLTTTLTGLREASSAKNAEGEKAAALVREMKALMVEARDVYRTVTGEANG